MSNKRRDTILACLKNMDNMEALRKRQGELMSELKRCLHYACFWPEAYKTPNAKTGKQENPKISFESAPGFGSGGFSITFTREDLDESHTFTFKTRCTRTKKLHHSEEAPEGWKEKTQYSSGDITYIEPHDIVVGTWGRRVVELIESTIEGLDVSEIPHEAVVAVTKQYAEQCL
ncbi:hypothetical protein DRO27_03680 [Candidatus Bathyarchaeota archaeon]|nr:MAG: hypothetical protein DRO27_03680 [Candidatus Bathyarchaeota archaeon]